MHLHSPEIFQRAKPLQLLTTDPQAEYGTQAMAAELQRLARANKGGGPALLVMGGHEDGIIAYGQTATETGTLIIQTLAKARAN